MPTERLAKTPFTLTPNELRILELHDAGNSISQIAEILGVTRGFNCHLSVAINKRRLLLLDEGRKRGLASLSVARGRVRMEGTK